MLVIETKKRSIAKYLYYTTFLEKENLTDVRFSFFFLSSKHIILVMSRSPTGASVTIREHANMCVTKTICLRVLLYV